MKKNCVICGKEFDCLNKALTCSKECSEAFWVIRNRKNTHKYTMRLKDEFFEHYGDKCAMCGESDKRVLTVDHINDDGADHRRRVGDNTYCVIRDLKVRNWPETEVQTLCYNCNAIKKMENQLVGGSSYSKKLREQALDVLGCICNHCGYTDPMALEIRPKNGNIKIYRDRYGGRTAILNAIIKDVEVRNEFEVLCVNCHRRKQYEKVI